MELLAKETNNCFKVNIIEKLWGYDTDAEENRRNIYIPFTKEAGSTRFGVYIQTILGAGYVLKTAGWSVNVYKITQQISHS